MNTELLQRLDDQAYNEIWNGDIREDESPGELKRERFAELIIRECLSVIEELAPHDKTRNLDDIWTGVYEHFGLTDD